MGKKLYKRAFFFGVNFLKRAKRERRYNEYSNDFTEFELLEVFNLRGLVIQRATWAQLKRQIRLRVI